MPRNQRLADAIGSSGRSVEDLASEVGAHPKTLERWVSSGRLPHDLAAGAAVRICLGDPDSDAVRLRGREEGSGDGMGSRCRIAIDYARPVLDADPNAVRVSDATLYCSIFRFDDELLANTHFWGNPAAESPVFHLRSRRGGGIAANLLRSFERVWDRAQPLAG
jgi:hypothetical protein